MPREPSLADTLALQDRMVGFVRAFGLHQPDQTPCGEFIPVSEAHALGELHRDEPLAQLELGARLRLEKSTVSRLVGQLEARGWVTRSRRDGDGRAVWLELTADGRRAAADLAVARATKFAALLERIPTDQRQGVLESLALLTEALHEQPDDHQPA